MAIVYGAKDVPAPDFSQTSGPPQDTAFQAFGRHAVNQAIPTAVGIPAAAAGAEAGGALGTLVGGPVGGIIGGIGGGVLGAVGAGTAAGAVQHQILADNPEFARTIGQSDEQLKASEEAHPLASFLGDLAPQAAFLHPDGQALGDLLKAGKTTAERLGAAGTLAAKGAVGGALQGGLEATQEYAEDGKVDGGKVLAAGLAGSLLHDEGPLGKPLGDAGRFVGRGFKGEAHAGGDVGDVIADDENKVEPAPEPAPESAPIYVNGRGQASADRTDVSRPQQRLLFSKDEMASTAPDQPPLQGTNAPPLGENGELFPRDTNLGEPPQGDLFNDARPQATQPLGQGELFKPGETGPTEPEQGELFNQAPAPAAPAAAAPEPKQLDMAERRPAAFAPTDFDPKGLDDALEELRGPIKNKSQGEFEEGLKANVAKAVASNDPDQIRQAVSYVDGHLDALQSSQLASKTVEGRTNQLGYAKSLLEQHLALHADENRIRTQEYADQAKARQAAGNGQGVQVGGAPDDPDAAGRSIETAGTLVKPEPAPAPEPGRLAPEDANTIAQNSIERQATDARNEILQKVLDDPETRNPWGRFTAELKKAGHSREVRAHEADQINRFEQARDGFASEGAREPLPGEAEAQDWRTARDNPEALTDAEQAQDQPDQVSPGQDAGGDGAQPVAGPAADNAVPRADGPAGVHARPADAGPRPVQRPARAEARPVEPVRNAAPGLDWGMMRERINESRQGDRISETQRQQLSVMADAAEKAGEHPAAFKDAVDRAELEHRAAKVRAARESRAQQMKDVAARLKAKSTGEPTVPSFKDPGAPAAKGEVARTGGEGSTRALDPGLKQELASKFSRAGLNDVGLRLASRVESRDGGDIAGRYDPARKLVEVAFGDRNGKYDADYVHQSFNHELAHAVDDLGLMTPAERRTLLTAAKKDPDVQKYLETHKDAPQGVRDQEAIAEYAAKHGPQREPTGVLGKVYAKVAKAIGAIRNAIGRFGSKNGMTAQDVVNRMFSGEMGARERGESGLDPSSRDAERRPQADDDKPKVTAADRREGIGLIARKWGLNLESMRQLADRNPRLRNDVLRMADALGTSAHERDALAAAAAPVHEAWGKLDPKVEREVGDLLQAGANAKADVADPSSGALYDRYNALPPEAQKVLKDVKDTFREQRQEYVKRLGETVDLMGLDPEEAKSIKADLQEDLKTNPHYFPAMRSGEHVVEAKSPDYHAASDAARVSADHLAALRAREAPKSDVAQAHADHQANLARLDALEQTDHWVSAHEDPAERAAVARALAEKFGKENVRQFTAKEFSARTDANAPGYMQKLNAAFDKMADLDPDLAEGIRGLKQMANELHFSMNPQGSALKAAFARKGTAGFDTDGRKVFARAVLRNGSYLAKLREGAVSRDAIAKMEEKIKGTPTEVKDGQDLNQIKKNYNQLGKYADNPVARLLTNTTYAYMLGLSPSFSVMHMMQTPLVTLPRLAAIHGFKAAGVLTGAMSETAAGMKNLLEGRELNFGKNDDEKAVLAAMIRHGLIDGTHADSIIHGAKDRGLMGQGAVGKTGETIMGVASFLPHYVEKMNRVGTVLASVRLAKADPKWMARLRSELPEEAYQQMLRDDPDLKVTHDQAALLRYAENITASTHVDYSNTGAAHVLQKGVLWQIFTQFQKYQQNALVTLFRYASDSFNKNLSEEDRWIARRTLIGVLGTHLLMTGLMGMPGYGALAAITNLYHKTLGDKDEPFDADDRFRQALNKALGLDAGNVAARGILYAPGIKDIAPVDVTDRLGMGDLLAPSGQNGAAGKLDREHLLEYLGQTAFGPSGSLAANFVDAFQKHEAGDNVKALEDVLPKSLRDLSRTYRFMKEGITTSSSNPVVKPEELHAMDLVAQLIGFTPQKAEEAYANRSAVEDARSELTDRKKNILKMYADAMTSDDADRQDHARNLVDEFNQKQRDQGLYNQTIKGGDMTKAVLDRRLAAARLQDGVAAAPKDRALVNSYGVNPPS